MQSLPSEKPTAGYSHPWQYFLLVYALSAPFWLLSLFGWALLSLRGYQKSNR